MLTAENRDLIKKHVMKDIGRARRKYTLRGPLKSSVQVDTLQNLFIYLLKADSLVPSKKSRLDLKKNPNLLSGQ